MSTNFWKKEKKKRIKKVCCLPHDELRQDVSRALGLRQTIASLQKKDLAITKPQETSVTLRYHQWLRVQIKTWNRARDTYKSHEDYSVKCRQHLTSILLKPTNIQVRKTRVMYTIKPEHDNCLGTWLCRDPEHPSSSFLTLNLGIPDL